MAWRLKEEIIMLINCISVGLGGFIGSVLRYLCNSIRVNAWDFPIITLGINAVGSFAIMFLSGILMKSFPMDSHLMLFVRVGLCGGFTTFSTFSAETLALFESGNVIPALLYAIGSCVICIGFAFIGELAASSLASA